MLTGVGTTVMENIALAAWAVGEVESVTVIEKFDVPVAVGVPEMIPLEERVSPAGSVPAVTAKV